MGTWSADRDLARFELGFVLLKGCAADEGGRLAKASSNRFDYTADLNGDLASRS